MARLIDADKLKAHYAWWADAGNADMRDAFDTIVDLQPTVDPTKHGRWIVCNDLYKTIDGRVFDGYRECSVCGEMYPYFPEHNYCPNCGARMDAQIGEDKSHPFAESVIMGVDGVETHTINAGEV